MPVPAAPTVPCEGGAQNRLAQWLAGALLLAAVAILLGSGPTRPLAVSAGLGCGGAATAYAVTACAVTAAPDASIPQRASRDRARLDAADTAACADPAPPRVADAPQVVRVPAATVYPVRSEIVPRPVGSSAPRRPPWAA